MFEIRPEMSEKQPIKLAALIEVIFGSLVEENDICPKRRPSAQ